MEGQFLGQIIGVAFNYAPKSWDTCAGQLLSIAQNAALFALLGTVYGGNGTTTFSLPDLRGRTPHKLWGKGWACKTIPFFGEQSGTQTVTMLASNVPLHTHTLMASNQTANAPAPGGNALAVGSDAGSARVFIWSGSRRELWRGDNREYRQQCADRNPAAIQYLAILHCGAGDIPHRETKIDRRQTNRTFY